ncbi:Popeye protein [Trinorchestia longiramus]|nr:Popeye protein [Trinorchestia longiramus]
MAHSDSEWLDIPDKNVNSTSTYSGNSQYFMGVLGLLPWCEGVPSVQHALFHAAHAIFLVAYAAPSTRTGLLVMHTLLIVGFLVYSTWAWNVVCARDVFSWGFSFTLLNLGQTLYVLYQTRPVKTDKELEAVYHNLFRPLNVERLLFKRLVSSECCQVSSLHAGEAYALENLTRTDRLGLLLSGKVNPYTSSAGLLSGKVNPYTSSAGLLLSGKVKQYTSSAGLLLSGKVKQYTSSAGLLLSGKVNVLSGGQVLHTVGPMQFLDSPEFESSRAALDDKFKVSIIAGTTSRYLFWKRSSLEYLFLKDQHLTTVLSTLVARDITTKLYSMNEKIVTEKGSHLDIRLPSLTASLNPCLVVLPEGTPVPLLHSPASVCPPCDVGNADEGAAEGTGARHKSVTLTTPVGGGYGAPLGYSNFSAELLSSNGNGVPNGSVPQRNKMEHPLH